MSSKKQHQRAFLLELARKAMVERGLEPDFPPEVQAELQTIRGPAREGDPPAGQGGTGGGAGNEPRDLRDLLWCSIDNDESRDLDQLTVSVPGDDGQPVLLVAIADVSAVVEPGSAIDEHASGNTTSVYTPPQVFSMLPEKLSTDWTSLVQDEDRLAIVAEVRVDGEAVRRRTAVYRARVRNKAKLAYPSVGAWLEGQGAMPDAIGAVPGLAANLKVQDGVTQRLKQYRNEHGALELDTLDIRTVFDGDTVREVSAEKRNRARELIEDAMIAANGTIARFLEDRRFPVVRRVLQSPERWPRIVDIAAENGEQLPATPDARALHDFLIRRRAADPLHFPDLSLSIIKLLGKGEYIASFPGETAASHFGLAVTEYTHSTAPNRRFPDLLTQRLVKAALSGGELPYSRDQLDALATHCTQKEDDAQKVERFMRKAAAACYLSDRIGQSFEGVVTGASSKGTWVRILDPPVEGRVEEGAAGLDVGDKVRVKLIHTDVEKGFIDFAATRRLGAAGRDGAPSHGPAR